MSEFIENSVYVVKDGDRGTEYCLLNRMSCSYIFEVSNGEHGLDPSNDPSFSFCCFLPVSSFNFDFFDGR